MSVKNASDASWLREQISDMADHATLQSTAWPMHEVRTALLAIASGKSWRTALFEQAMRRTRGRR